MNLETPLEHFRDACGLGGPMTLSCRSERSPDEEPSIVVPPAPFLLIGRSPRTDLSLPDDQVSRRHAYLQAVAGGVVCVDLKSRTGIRWDDAPEARPWGWLEPGRSALLGPYRIERTDRGPDDEPGGDRPDPFAATDEYPGIPGPLPRLILELPFRVGGVATTWEIPGLLALVGRDDHCQLVLGDDSISRTHAALVRTPVGTWVVELEARQGLLVNGTRVRWAWLADGDIVRFGLFTMVVRYDRAPEGLSREDVPLEAGAAASASGDDDLPAGIGGRNPTAGRGLAIRPKGRPPGLRGAAPIPSRVIPAGSDMPERVDWQPDFAMMGPSPQALWQQQIQLMESFHNDMMMMVQMFVAMHREFRSSIRDELKQVQKLSEQLVRLNEQLLQAPGPAEAGAEPKAARDPSPERAGRPAPQVSGKPRVAPTTAPPAGSPAARPGETGKRAERPRIRPEPAAPTPPRLESTEMYADITRRITEIQRERRGYWQRILEVING